MTKNRNFSIHRKRAASNKSKKKKEEEEVSLRNFPFSGRTQKEKEIKVGVCPL